MVAELCFNRALDFVDRGTEHDAVKLGDHLTGAKGTEIAAITAGGATGMLLCQGGEIFTGGNF